MWRWISPVLRGLVFAACLCAELSGMFVKAADAVQRPFVECDCAGPRYANAYSAFQLGHQWATLSDARCVDRYFASALLCWEDIAEGLSDATRPQLRHRSLSLYHSAVLSCVLYGHRLGRLNPSTGLTVLIGDAWKTIPVVGQNLNWRLDQIDCFRAAMAVPKYAHSIRSGFGVALLGIHYRRPEVPGEERFLPEHPTAITAVLRPHETGGDYRLELHSPMEQTTIVVAGRELRLSSNIGAAVDFAMNQLETEVNPLTAFFNPEIAVSHEGLLLIQPYHPEKIPVVLVHGLLSNPATWGILLNELLNNPELMKRYQLWAYLYPTSVPFLQTAAELRKELRHAVAFYDPNQTSAAINHMVLVGHSMGGLLSRLQVTWSGNFLWDEFSRVSLGELRLSPRNRQALSEVFFFGPQPFVKRVIFIAVPHQGSRLSTRLIGCVGRLLAGRPLALQELWAELQELNPGALRISSTRQLPSSVAGLAPGSPALRGLGKLPFSPEVSLHSIIGTGGCNKIVPGDGVVRVESARVAGVVSELLVDATHTGAKEHPHTLVEVQRILWQHWQIFASQCPLGNETVPAPEPTPVLLPNEIKAVK